MSQERSPVLWNGQVAVVTLPGEIDVNNADTVQEDLLAVLDHDATLLVADLSKTTFCDSAGVSALVQAFRRATNGGTSMRLVVATPAVQRVLSITGVNRLVEVFPSVADSLAGPFGQGGPPPAASAAAKA